MYHWSTSSPSPCYSSSNGKTLVSSQHDDLLSSPSMSSYGLLQEQQCYYPQQPSIRRVQSAGDLVPPVPPVAAARYSAEERRERIEKYRSKRNQRNFQKKITYACRKTLADSRPRVKGRFARNDDAAEPLESFTDAAAEVSSSLMSEGNVVDAAATDASSSMPEWWPAMQGALAMEDEELLASYLGVSTINLY